MSRKTPVVNLNKFTRLKDSESDPELPARDPQFEQMMRTMANSALDLISKADGHNEVKAAAASFAAALEAALQQQQREGTKGDTGCVQARLSSVATCCRNTTATVFTAWCTAIGAFMSGIRTPLLFYLFGCIAYSALEGWSARDTVYFLTVTSTTVGYGDFYPTSTLGKLFTCVYAVLGITVVLNALSPLVAVLRGDWREKLINLVLCSPQVDTEDPNLTMAEVNRRISYPRRYAAAMFAPVLVLVAGMLLHYTMIRDPPPAGVPSSLSLWVAEWCQTTLGVELEVEDSALLSLIGAIDWLGLIDSFYWAVVTMTTIGYGDITPSTDDARALATIYLPFAVIALADALSDLQMITVRCTTTTARYHLHENPTWSLVALGSPSYPDLHAAPIRRSLPTTRFRYAERFERLILASSLMSACFAMRCASPSHQSRARIRAP